MGSLRDATVVIIGASSGIGLATAHAFARRGANVVVAARRRDLLERAARGCEALGGRALAAPTDVTDPAQVRELAGAAASAFGGIDVWVNNAGTSMWGPFEGIPRRSVRVGSANAVVVPFALAPDTTGRLVGKLARRFLLGSGPEAATTDGGLQETVPTDEAAVRGGWGMPERARARRAAGLTAVAAFAGLAGASVLLSRRARRAWPSPGEASR